MTHVKKFHALANQELPDKPRTFETPQDLLKSIDDIISGVIKKSLSAEGWHIVEMMVIHKPTGCKVLMSE